MFAQLHSMLTVSATPKSLARFDQDIQILVEDLKATGRFENSIIVIWSDHGQGYAMHRRLPLIIKFPEQVELPGLERNAQTIDIAPTLLDYLGWPIPSWMEGSSMFEPVARYKPIFCSDGSSLNSGIEPGADASVAPGGLRSVSVIFCNRWYHLQLPSGDLETRWIEGHTTPCEPDDLPSEDEATAMLLRHLTERGYHPGIETH